MFDLGRAVGYLLLDTSGFTSGFTAARRDLSTFMDSTQNAQTRVNALGGAFTSAGATLTKNFSVPLLGIATAAVKVTADFDSQMAKVAAISGATGNDFDKLREKAREMGEKTKFSATEAGQAFEYMAMAGWKTEDMLNGVEGVMNLAAAAGEELGLTSDIVTDALTAFGMQAEDSAHFADILAAASSNANTNVAMMGETFKYVAPVAGAMGYSAEDTAVAIGLMANSGIKATQAGTSLRGIISRMAKPTDEVAHAMDVLGLSLEDGNGHMYSLMEVMEQLREGFNVNLRIPAEEVQAEMQKLDAQFENGEITEKEYAEAQDELMQRAYGATGALKAKEAAALAGRNAMSGLLAIVNASDEDFQMLTEAVQHSSDVFVKTKDGAIMPMSQALEEGVEWVEEYNGAAERMASVMQDNLSGQLTILLSQLQELAISIGDLLMPHLRNTVAKIQEWVDKLNNMDEGTRETIVNIGLFVAAIGPALLIIGKVITAVSTVIGVVSKAGVALKALFAVMAANPITIVIAAIAALAAAFVYFWNTSEGFRQFWINLWEKAKEVAGTAAEALKITFSKVSEFLKNLSEDFKTIVSFLVDYVKNTLDRIKAFFSEFSESLKTAWNNVYSSVSQFMGNLGEKIKSIAGSIKDSVIEIFHNVSDSIVNFIQKVVNSIKSLYQSVSDGFKNVMDSISGFIHRIAEFFSNLATSMAEGFRNAVSSVSEFFNDIVEFFRNIVSSISNVFSSISDSVSNFIQRVSEFFSNLATSISNGLKSIADAASQFVQNIIGAFSDMAKSLYNSGVNAFTQLHKGAAEAWGTFAKWISQALRAVIDAVLSFGSSMYQAGRNIFGQLWQGVASMWNEIASWINEKIQQIRDAFANIRSSVSNAVGRVTGSYATGADYILSDRIVQVHEGEAILSKEENRERERRRGSTTPSTLVLNITETIDGMVLAKNQYKYNIELDNNHGISLINT